ncbi:MAG: type I restriction-modification system subunit M [Bacilli bacterium]|nr:type I restriction-modification system subunit M [Bacilli bacterium]
MNQNKQNLYSTLWKIIDELQGATDAWSFKYYPIILLFYRFLSTNLINYVKETFTINYLNLSDNESLAIKQKTIADNDFFILPSKLFQNVIKTDINSQYLNVILDSIFNEIETSSKYKLTGIFREFDAKSNVLGETDSERSNKLAQLLLCIKNLKQDDINDTENDTFGDIYEFLINNYARTSGRLGGVYFTPNTLSTLLSKIANLYIDKPKNIYDPTCGTGSLLLEYIKQNSNVEVYGQEISPSSYNLCKMNMILHNVKDYNLTLGDTLAKPISIYENKFDIILSNPPFRTKWDSSSICNEDKRFNGLSTLPPNDKADYAFILHSLYTLNENGVAAIVVSPGILNRGHEEKLIREYLVKKNLIDTIVLLPSNLFYGTSINVCIMTLRKKKEDNNILFVDATSEYIKNNKRNELSNNNIDNILTLVKERKTFNGKSYLASANEIINNSYNLAITSYVKTSSSLPLISFEEIAESLESITAQKQKLLNELHNHTKDIDFFIKNSLKSNNKVIPLNNVAHSIRTGLNPRDYFNLIDDGPYYYITPKEIMNQTIVTTSQTKKVNVNAKKRINGYSHFEVGDVLFSLSGDEIKTAIVEETHKDYDINESIYIIKPNLDLINPKYLMYLLESDYLREQINKNLCYGRIKKIGIQKFRELPIPEIPKDIQNQISDQLDKLKTIKLQLETLHAKEGELIINKYQHYKSKPFESNKNNR